MKNNFFEKITHNYKLKLGCIAAAILIFWLHTVSNTDRKTFIVPLEVVSNGSYSISSGLENRRNIKISVSAERGDLVSVSENDFRAWIDVSNIAKEGKVNVPVFIKADERLLALDSIEVKAKPDYLTLELTSKSFADVDLVATLKGNCDFGYEVDSVEIEPKVIRVQGPENIVNSMKKIQTDTIIIDGLKQSAQFTVSPVNINSLVTLDSSVKITVKVNVKESHSAVDFSDLNLNFINLAEKFAAESEVKKVAVKIEGTSLAMKNISQENISASVDLSQITETGVYELPVNVSVPEGIKINIQVPLTVSVNVLEKKEDVPEENVQSELTEENIDEEIVEAKE